MYARGSAAPLVLEPAITSPHTGKSILASLTLSTHPHVHLPQDHFWPPHAEAYALLARLSALVWNRTAADQLAAANTVNRYRERHVS